LALALQSTSELSIKQKESLGSILETR
jgi:hypothetical protein